MLPTYFSRFNGELMNDGIYNEDYWHPQATKVNILEYLQKQK